MEGAFVWTGTEVLMCWQDYLLFVLVQPPILIRDLPVHCKGNLTKKKQQLFCSIECEDTCVSRHDDQFTGTDCADPSHGFERSRLVALSQQQQQLSRRRYHGTRSTHITAQKAGCCAVVLFPRLLSAFLRGSYLTYCRQRPR